MRHFAEDFSEAMQPTGRHRSRLSARLDVKRRRCNTGHRSSFRKGCCLLLPVRRHIFRHRCYLGLNSLRTSWDSRRALRRSLFSLLEALRRKHGARASIQRLRQGSSIWNPQRDTCCLGLQARKGTTDPGDPLSCLRGRPLRIGKDASAYTAIESVAPKRLDGEGSGT